MNRSRRYLRWIKRALIIYAVYLLIGVLLFGASPVNLTFRPGATFEQYRPLMVQMVFLFFVLVIQFAGMFWFLTRGTTYVVYPNEYDHTFDDVRGQPAAVRSTKEVLRLFMGFKNFKQMGGYPPHGILFEGPPGTGKTLMAKAIAGSAGVPIIVADGSRFMSAIMGIGNLKIRRMFTKARNMSDKYGGAVIFIDELDALASSRGGVSERMDASPRQSGIARLIVGAGMGGGMGMVNELLVGLDGFVQPRGLWRHFRRIFRLGKPKVPFYNILIIGATNRARSLDRALLRPGRFDRKIHVGLPDHEGRQDIARYYLAKVRHEPIDVAKFARLSQSYSPARIKNVINEALIFALQEGRDALRWDDLWQAKLVDEIGLKQPVKLTPREKEMVAVHEAAHAVASYTLERGDRQIQVITIQKREGTLGLVHGQSVEDLYTESQKQILARIQVLVAGHAAEEIWFGQLTSGSGSDLQNATFLAAAYVGFNGMGKQLTSLAAGTPYTGEINPVQLVLGDPDRKKEVDELLHWCRRQTVGLLKRKRRVVEGVRDALLEREELIGDEIEEVMAQLGERDPLPVPAGATLTVDEAEEEAKTGRLEERNRPSTGRGNGRARGNGRGNGRTRRKGNEPPDGPPGGATPPQPPNDDG